MNILSQLKTNISFIENQFYACADFNAYILLAAHFRKPRFGKFREFITCLVKNIMYLYQLHYY